MHTFVRTCRETNQSFSVNDTQIQDSLSAIHILYPSFLLEPKRGEGKEKSAILYEYHTQENNKPRCAQTKHLECDALHNSDNVRKYLLTESCHTSLCLGRNHSLLNTRNL
jgi:hypothetical protein